MIPFVELSDCLGLSRAEVSLEVVHPGVLSRHRAGLFRCPAIVGAASLSKAHATIFLCSGMLRALVLKGAARRVLVPFKTRAASEHPAQCARRPGSELLPLRSSERRVQASRVELGQFEGVLEQGERDP